MDAVAPAGDAGSTALSTGSAGSADPRQLRAALALAGLRGLSPAGVRRLVDEAGDPLAALALSAARLAGTGLRPGVLRRLRAARPVPEEVLRRLTESGLRLTHYGAPDYPESLFHLHHPPVVLYLAGPAPLPGRRAVAIVGTRRATEYGRRMSRDLAGQLARRGWVVVSGMARGIDGAAHRGALDAGGVTVGVVGAGLDRVYPAAHRDLFRRMRGRGLLVSEFPPGTTPAPGLFPRRNRIIAALARAVIVVQAPARSGALITVQHALELGRQVFAVPGPVGPEASEGVHALLKDGAAPITEAADLLRCFGGAPSKEAGSPEPEPTRDPGAAGLLRELRRGSGTADELALAAGLPISEALARLGALELEGRVRALPGGRWAPGEEA